MNRKANVKDIQAHLRHSRASTTLNEYIQQVPDSVRQAVDWLDSSLKEQIEAIQNANLRVN